MFIQNNINSMNALNNLNTNETQLTSSIQKLSSGFRLNRAGDDAAGMSIANSLRNNESGLLAAQQNASQAGSVLQIADGATQTISTILDRMKQLATESASSNVTDTDRAKIQAEFTSLQSEIDRTVNGTVYQGQTLLAGTFGIAATGGTATGLTGLSVGGAAADTFTFDGSVSGKLTLTNSSGSIAQTLDVAATGTQALNFDKLGVSFTYTGDPATDLDQDTVITSGSSASFRVGSGASNDTDNTISLTLGNLTTASAGLDLASSSVGTMATAQAALAKITTAVATLNTTIGTIGAAESRLGYATTNLNSLYQNVSAAESVIRDTNMAQEYTTFSKLQILQQAGTAMLAQANSSQQSVLKLFQ